jgi:hypothetical protein
MPDKAEGRSNLLGESAMSKSHIAEQPVPVAARAELTDRLQRQAPIPQASKQKPRSIALNSNVCSYLLLDAQSAHPHEIADWFVSSGRFSLNTFDS